MHNDVNNEAEDVEEGDGANGDPDPDVIHESLENPVAGAKAFLDGHPLAKIVVVIDTHSESNGSFIWGGNSPETYKTCSMNDVSDR